MGLKAQLVGMRHAYLAAVRDGRHGRLCRQAWHPALRQQSTSTPHATPWPGEAGESVGKSRRALLRQRHCWGLEAFMDAVRDCLADGAIHTSILVDGLRYASNAGSMLRHLSILQGPGSAGG